MSEEADTRELHESFDASFDDIEGRQDVAESTQERILAAILRIEVSLQNLGNRIDLLHDQVVEGFRKHDLRLKRAEANGNGVYHIKS